MRGNWLSFDICPPIKKIKISKKDETNKMNNNNSTNKHSNMMLSPIYKLKIMKRKLKWEYKNQIEEQIKQLSKPKTFYWLEKEIEKNNKIKNAGKQKSHKK